MATKADIEAYLMRASLEFEELEDGTLLVSDQEARATIAVRVDDPIVVFRMKVMELGDGVPEPLMRRLLELNAHEMLYASFGLEGNAVVSGGTLQLDNLDYNEFQAMIDDLFLAVSRYHDSLQGLAGER